MMWASTLLAEACGAVLSGPHREFQHISIDGRTTLPGSLFVALKGENFDGHRFVAQAIEAGAAGVVISEPVDGLESVTTLSVGDTLQALQKMAFTMRRCFSIPLIAITGSNGKTTTKELIASILRAHWGADSVLATVGNLNNHIGVPLTLMQLTAAHRVAVIEMGMNHFDEIALLTQLASPTIAVITNAAPAHLEGVGSLAGVAKAKGEVFYALSQSGVAILNADDYFLPYWEVLNRDRRCIRFGFSDCADVNGVYRDEILSIQIKELSLSLTIQLSLKGEHNARNALAATAIALALDIPPATIKQGLETATNISGRLTRQMLTEGICLIDDSYNANPASMRAAAAVLCAERGARFLVLGDMGELGSAAADLHTSLLSDLQQMDINGIFILGPRMLHANTTLKSQSNISTHEDVESLVRALLQRVKNVVPTKAATILVKGSRAMAMERVINKLQLVLTKGDA